MNRDEITQILLDAMETLAEGKIEDAGLDQSVEAVVVRCLSYATGEYIVKYSGGTFSAYAKDLDKIYQPDSIVKVLIPKGDASQVKIILSEIQSAKEKENEGENVADILTVEPIGTNICKVIDETDNCWHFCTGDSSDTEHQIYDKDDLVNSKIEIDSALATYYLLPAGYIQLSANFRTEIPRTRQRKGNFGIECVASFLDPLVKDENNQPSIVDRTYRLDINNMIGTPYTQIDKTNQEAHFLIDGTNFVEIKNVRLFCLGFDDVAQGETLKPDIFISDLSIRGMVDLEKDENGYSLRILTQQDPYTDSMADIQLQAEVFKDYKYQDINANTAECYWFKENHEITNSSDKYLECGGPGWECLNEVVETNGVKFYKTGTPIINIPSKKLSAKETRIKCIVKFKKTDIVLTKQSVIINLINQYFLELTSSNGESTFLDSTTITAAITPNDGRNFTYNWSYEVDDKLLQKLDENESSLLVDLTQVVDHIKVYCTIRDADFDDEDVAINSIVIKRIPETILVPYTLTILNGDQVFRYDANGISPAAESNAVPQKILPLEIQLVDENGNRVPNDSIDYQWEAPDVYSGTLIKDFTDNSDGTATFDIDTYYNMNLLNNTIKVIVHYDNMAMEARTNFFFVRDGENGSNGTNCVVKVVPNGTLTDSLGYWYTKNDTSIQRNYITPSGANPVKLNFYKDGKLYFDSAQESFVDENGQPILTSYSAADGFINGEDSNEKLKFDFTMLTRVYDGSHEDETHFTIGDTYKKIVDFDTNNFDIGSSLGQLQADILKAEVNYRDNKYYYYYPIPYIQYNGNKSNINNFNIKIVPNTGFTEVMYAEDGRNPLYKGTPQFKFIVELLNEEYTSVNYTYQVVGQIYKQVEENTPTWYDSNDLSIDSLHNLKPAEIYDGNCVTNAEIITIVDQADNILIATIHIPVIMYLNTYGHKYINDWDGVSIELNNEGGVALMPQIVAGSKDSGNGFTGIVGGKVKDNATGQASDLTNIGFKHGLFGYNNGQQTFALNALDGSASFGATGIGQIQIVPGNSAIIQSGNYAQGTGGMLIDLTTPKIEWGNGNFSVNANGTVHAGAGDFTGTITATGGNIGSWTIDSVLYSGSGSSYVGLGTSGDYRIWAGNSTASSAPFSVKKDGTLKATSGTIGNWNIGANSLWNGGTEIAPTLYLGTTGITASIGGTSRSGLIFKAGANFGVTNTGILYAGSGYLGGWQISGKDIKYGSTTTLNGSSGKIKTSSLECTGGTLNIGDKFTVSSTGRLVAKGAGTVGEEKYWFSMNSGSQHPNFSGINVNTKNGIAFRANNTDKSVGSETVTFGSDSDTTTSGFHISSTTATININHGTSGQGEYKNIGIGDFVFKPKEIYGYDKTSHIYMNNRIVLVPNNDYAYINSATSANKIATSSSGPSSKNVKTNFKKINNNDYNNLYFDLQKINMYDYDYKYKNVNGKLSSDFGFIIDEIEESPILKQYFRNYSVRKYINQNNELTIDKSGTPIEIKEWERDSYIKGLFILIKALQNKIDDLERRISKYENK